MRLKGKYRFKLEALLSFILMIGFVSCDYLEFLGKEGEMVSDEVAIEGVGAIVVDAPYHIHLIQSDEHKILLEGYDFLMKDVIITEEDGVLIIDHLEADYIQKSKKLKLSLFAPDFSKFTINKPVEFTSEGVISGNSLWIVFNGGASFSEMNLNLNYSQVSVNAYGLDHVGKYKLKGECDVFKLTFEGSANVNAVDMSSKACYLNHRSINYCKVNCQEKLKVHVYNTGDTYYAGNPEIETERTGLDGLKPSGEIIHIME
ncbi:DUF2807 domain-containing protein [Labilibacter sediminis]|nr:DUF2807 domain-containing protein [Labilibacter sediminis]